MKKIVLVTLILATVTLGWQSCSRYEDGPFISLRSRINRIVGNYEVEKLLVNGLDKTTEFEVNLAYCNEFKIYKDRPGLLAWTVSRSGTEVYNSGIRITVPKTHMNLGDRYELYGHYYGAVNQDLEWEIVKLTNDQLWFKTTYNDSKYELHYKKV